MSASSLRFARRWLPLLLLGLLLGGVAGFLVIQRLPPVYEATVTLLVGQGSIASTTTPADDIRGAEQLAQTYAEAVRTRPVLTGASNQIGVSLSFKELTERVHARRVPNTQLLRISAEDTDPNVAAKLANAVAQVFVDANQQIQNSRFAASRENLRQLVESLQGDLATQTLELEEVRAEPSSPERDSALATLQSRVTQLQALHGETLRSYENLRVVEARGMNTLTAIEPAAPPEEPIRPNRYVVMFVAILAGLGLAGGFAGLAEYFDDALRDRQRVALATGLTTLGSIPRGEAGTNLSDPAARRLAEAYRLLRTNILASIPAGQPLRMLLIAGPGQGEGKSTTAANIAVVLAESGQRVILVDADLHHPSQAIRFGTSARHGLASLLLDPAGNPAELLHSTRVANLKLLPAGATRADPSALLSSQRTHEVLNQLHKLCDVLVVDTPPLLAQPDAALLGTRADGVLLVLDATRSRGRGASRAVEMLRESGAPVLGAVLNRVPRKAMEYHGYASSYSIRAAEQPAPKPVEPRSIFAAD